MHQADDREFSQGEEAQVLRMRLKTPPRVPRFMYGVSVLSAMTFMMIWGSVAAGEELILLVVAAIGAVLPLLVVVMREPRGTPVFELGFDRVRLPRTAEITDQIVLTYREIDALFVRPGAAGFLWVGTTVGTFMYPRNRFRRPQDVEMLCAALQARIEARLPDGVSRVETFAKASAAAIDAYSRRIPVSIALIVLIVAGTILTSVLRSYDVFNLVYGGALITPLVLEHEQWWRIGAAPWVSMLPDGVIAATTLGVFGVMIERLFGAAHVLTIAVLAVALGTGLTLLTTGTVSAGATPIAIGMFTALAFTTQGFRTRLPLGFQPPALSLVFSGVLLFVLTYRMATIDFSMMAGGALAGVIVTALRIKDDTEFPVRGPTPWLLTVISAVGLIGAVVSGVMAVRSFQSPHPAESTALLTVARDRDWGWPRVWNHMGWTLAIATDPKAEDLELASALLERAIRRVDDLPEQLRESEKNQFVDTLATIRYRQFRFNEAIRLQQSVVAVTPKGLYATQLARFLDGRVRTGSSTVTSGLPSMELTHQESRGFGLIVHGAAPSMPVIVWGVVRAEDALVGLLRFSLSPATPTGQTIWLKRRGTQAEWPPDALLIPADVKPGDVDWLAWGMDEYVLGLPMIDPADAPPAPPAATEEASSPDGGSTGGDPPTSSNGQLPAGSAPSGAAAAVAPGASSTTAASRSTEEAGRSGPE